ncbi:MAG: class I SAM-dependent methyltransferase [Thermoplasmata archaeon]|nr:class I SAM-dependent methyltransferase [Thermoplasmata archaeon]
MDTTVYGFDSFEGLPEDWGPGFRKGHFKTRNRPKLVKGVRLVVGWFEDVLPDFLADHPGQVAFAHIDSDVYSSASYVLTTLAEAGRLGEGTVLQFDEMFTIRRDLWYRGEYDAFREFVEQYKVKYEWLGRTDEAAALCINRMTL